MKIMRGPNIWSRSHNQLIVIKYDPLLYYEIGKNQQIYITDYFRTHYNLEPLHEDFNLRLFRYSLQLAALLQGKKIYHDITFPSPDIYYGVVEYKIEEAGRAAVELASSILKSVIVKEDPLPIESAIEKVQEVSLEYSQGPTTSLIIDAARKRNIPVTSGAAGYTILGYGKNQKRISAAISHNTSCIAVNIAGNKEHTKKFLQSANLPVPKGTLVRDENDLNAVADLLGYPLVTKPFNGNQGRNITCNIINFENLLTGFRFAKEASRSVIVEKEIKGDDYRFLVIGNKFIAASLRLPASVVGDGDLKISDLVEKENRDPRRGKGHQNILTKIELDSASHLCLEQQGYSHDSIPPEGKKVYLKTTANLSTGGTAQDVTDIVHPSNIRMAEKVSKVIGLDICGIDIMSSDITQPLVVNDAAIIEVNAAPGLRMHKYPNKGVSREVGEPIVQLMFEKGDEGRIPIVAITGTNGKTTTTRLMAHVASFVDYIVGFSSTDGIFIDGDKILSGDCSGPQSARTILQDPTVDFAVLECARGGILRAGLGFDQCDIAIVTNVAADHLGLMDINTVEDLAKVKAVVPNSVKKEGYAILNASNKHAVAMMDNVQCKVGLFCLDQNNEHLQEHIKSGGYAVFTNDKQDIFITKDDTSTFIFNAAEVPITRNAKAGFMIENLLPVVLASYLLGIEVAQIQTALKSFIPNSHHTPGRISEFDINGVNVIVDYAHNPHGLRALSGYLENLPERKLGIITGTGDRRDEDIIEFGRIAASTYDEIIIRFDRDLRGRTKESIIELLLVGIHEINPQQLYKIIPDTKSAIRYAVANVQKGSYVVICADNANYTVGLTKEVASEYELGNKPVII